MAGPLTCSKQGSDGTTLLNNFERPTFEPSRSATDRLTNPEAFLQALLRLDTYGRKQPFLESWVLILTGRHLTRALILDIQRPGGAGSSGAYLSGRFDACIEASPGSIREQVIGHKGFT